MKITTRTSDLAAGLKRVIGTVERANIIPILGNVLLTAAGGALKVKATNLDMVIETSVLGEVASEGQITVPAHMLASIVGKMPKDGNVTIDLQDSKLSVRCGRSRFNLFTLPAEDFPDLAQKESSHKFDLTSDQVGELFGRTEVAISTEPARYYLNGVFLQPFNNGKGGTLRGVATDGHKLARIDCQMPEGADGFSDVANKATGGIIVPTAAVKQIKKIASDVSGVRVQISPALITVSTDSTALTSKLIDGTFPDYARVIPINYSKTMSADKEELVGSIERITTVASDRGRAIRLDLSAGKLKLSVSNPDAGNAEEEVDVDWNSDPFVIGFNSQYLIDILGEIESEKVEMRLEDGGSPSLIQGSGDENAIFVLMPMRV